MGAVLSLVVCLSALPHVCETVIPEYTHISGEQLTFFECLTAGGQDIARQWLAEHPSYELRRIQCSIASDVEKLRSQLLTPEA